MQAFVLVLYYSAHGHTASLAESLALGIESVAGIEARVRTVEPVASRCAHSMPSVPASGPPYATKQDLIDCSALALGSPTRFGNMAAPLKYFLDQTADLWQSGALIDKAAAVFTSTGSLHGGQESTLLSMMLPLMHHGMMLLGVPYSEQALHDTTTGGTPYGASHLAGNQNQNAISPHEHRIAQTLGRRLAHMAQRYAKTL